MTRIAIPSGTLSKSLGGCLLCAGLFLLFPVAPTVAADRIILRNLKVLTDKTVASFDEDGVRLNDATVLSWAEIESAKITADQQAAFDKLLAELGNDLYRIQQRLAVGDYPGALPHAEALLDRYAGRSSDVAYMVMQATMWGRLAVGRREEALWPYLRCYEVLRARRTTRIPIPGERRLDFDPQTALTAELAPIWFHAEAAKSELPRVLEVIRTMPERPDGLYIYFATLAIAAGDDATAQRALTGVRSTDGSVAELREIVAAQREILSQQPAAGIAKLQVLLASISSANKPLAWYWLGRAELMSADMATRQHGVLDLLRIAALAGGTQPELSGAALFEVIQAFAEMQDVRGSAAVRAELLSKYGNTYHAKLLNSRRSSEPKP